MMSDDAFESTGGAGKAQAPADRSDASTMPETASPEVLIIVNSSPLVLQHLFYSTNDCTRFVVDDEPPVHSFCSSTIVQFERLRLVVVLDEHRVHIIALPVVRARHGKPHMKRTPQ
jgi:hypothetical protein